MAQNCANCHYVRNRTIERQVQGGIERREGLICAHQSPIAGDPRAVWPEVLPGDWCGVWSSDGEPPDLRMFITNPQPWG